MRADTSGLLLTHNKDGSVTLEIVDYDVEEFGGRDLEFRYDLDSENADILSGELKKLHNGDLKEMLVAEFSRTFNAVKFERFCKEHGIRYKYSSWS